MTLNDEEYVRIRLPKCGAKRDHQNNQNGKS